MRTVRRLLYRDICASVVLVVLAFLALFYFVDFVEELERMARVGVGPGKAAVLSLMELPGRFYELFPIGVLIGSIVTLARLAQSSEFTILRTGGLGPGRALGLLAGLAAGFALLTFLMGDFVAPQFERWGDEMRGRLTRNAAYAAKGAWLKDHQMVDGRERSYSVHVRAVGDGGQLTGVRIFEFDERGALLSRREAASADVNEAGLWRLHEVHDTQWSTDAPAVGAPAVRETEADESQWQSGLTAKVVSAAMLPAMSMSTLELYRYTKHLSAQEQSAQAHSIQFWRRALYPFACFVMIALALPFAYLHGRSGGISYKVFGGIMLGISFILLNNVAGHLGLLKNWTPWAVAAAPSLLYLALSMAAFTWLVRYR
ncbi:LPS export ABC transporter permease LptG [Roseateles paludis]|jgi:lipopolysaccharide export system permease protein|uniref:LPS export ABC transporter permease LptG n=1 Tax=Roseateles paludis TaxID=3145238 RepID=A0ABV0G083_9BURK